jgi:Transglutaminase elicitor
MKSTLIMAALILSGSAFAEKWGGRKLFRKNIDNDPSNFNIIAKRPMRYDYANLKKESYLEDKRFGWSENFWPANKGGIAFRWNQPDAVPFSRKFHTKEQLQRMTQEQLAQLSPAELYDIAMGDYKYTLTNKTLDTWSPDDQWWEGVCQGWSQAAANYPEPAPVVITNKDGIQVPFGSSDVKGLLSMHDAKNSAGMYARVGNRCKVYGKVHGEAFEEDGVVPFPDRKEAESDNCRDTNAGAFHVVLTNMIGENQQSFVAEVDRFNDVWNQPVTGYTSEEIGSEGVSRKEREDGIASKVRVKTTMQYGDELEFRTEENEAKAREKGEVWGWVSKLPVTNTDQQMFAERHYEYILELDNLGNIVGGEWISESRPDMIWMKKPDAKFLDADYPLAGLNKIYRPTPKVK